MKKINKLFICVNLVVVLIIALNGCDKQSSLKNEGDTPITSTTFSILVDIGLSLSKAPALGESTELTVTIGYTGKVKEDTPETLVTLELPEGFELVDGDLDWRDYVGNEQRQFSVIIKAVKIGNWTIKAKARSPPTGKGYIGGNDQLYVSVLEDKGIISDKPFPLPEREDVDNCIKIDDSEAPPKKEILPDEKTPEPTIE